MIFSGFTIYDGGLSQCNQQWNHTHGEFSSFHRLYYLIDGDAAMDAGSGWQALIPQAIHWIPAHRLVRRRCPEHMTVSWLHLRPESVLIDAALDSLRGIHSWPAQQWEHWLPTCHLFQELRADRPPTRIIAAIQALITLLAADLVGDELDRRANGRSDWMQRLEPAVAFMDRCSDQHPPLSEVAETVDLSPSHFHRCFTACFHLTPHAYMERLRMRRAHDMLRAGGTTVTEVAEAVGYASLPYFSRAFRRHHGFTAQTALTGLADANP